MKRSNQGLSRSDFVRAAITLPALGALFAAATEPALADKMAQSAAKYQSKPNAGKKCSTCTLFVAGKTPTANGTCKVVAGDISPNGWCTLYSPKSS